MLTYEQFPRSSPDDTTPRAAVAPPAQGDRTMIPKRGAHEHCLVETTDPCAASPPAPRARCSNTIALPHWSRPARRRRLPENKPWTGNLRHSQQWARGGPLRHRRGHQLQKPPACGTSLSTSQAPNARNPADVPPAGEPRAGTHLSLRVGLLRRVASPQRLRPLLTDPDDAGHPRSADHPTPPYGGAGGA